MPARSRTHGDVCQLHIALQYTEPLVWRRVLVPPELTLSRLHQTIQIAMGWTNSHMHEFRAGKKIYGAPDEDHDPFGITRRADERHVLVRELLPRIRSRAFYTYDFGDSWEHEISLEKLQARDPATIYPLCIGGEMACPPEDCGGISGYYHLVEAMRDPQHPEHEEMVESMGEVYDPVGFTIEQVNRIFQRRKSRRTARRYL